MTDDLDEYEGVCRLCGDDAGDGRYCAKHDDDLADAQHGSVWDG